MKNSRRTTLPSIRFWSWLLVMVLSMSSASPAFADKIKDSSNFTVTEHNGYVTFEIMLMDGNWSDTWCRVGSVHAYSGSGGTGTDLQIMDVETDHDDDDRTNWEFFARNTTNGSIAYLANPSNSGAVIEIKPAAWNDWKDGNNDDNRKARPSSVKYTCEKSSSNLCPTVKIDFYYPPEMAGKRWYFYYEYIHNKGSFNKMEMGNAYCSTNFVDLNFDASAFDVKRNGPDKLKVTIPQVTRTVESKLQSNRWYECKYKLVFDFVTQENKTVSITQEYDCDRNQKKTYDVTIPESVGNFKSVTCRESYTYGLKCTNGKFYGNPYTHTSVKQNLFPMVPMPFGLNAEYNQYENRADLVWNAFPTGSTNIIKECTPYVYRVETNQNGEPLSGQSWSKRGTLDLVGDMQDEGYTDKQVQANTYYKYMVLNVPKAWVDDNLIKSSDLNSPSDKLIHQLGYCYSSVMQTSPEMKYYQLQQDTVVKDRVRLTWGYSRIPVSAQNVKFEVLRRLKGETTWVNYGNVSAPSNPSADYKAEFIDNKLPSIRETFEYKIRLVINNEKNTFESDIVTAGLLTGSAVTAVSATKGTHETVVRVSWKVKQVGTDNSNFEVFRRYAGTTDEFLAVYSVSGTSDSYTYEDNTVQPGYYYEYKVDVYNGEKDTYTDNNYQNSLSDVGFCQARGVVSGRITFGSGSAVENVRMSLRSSADTDGNVVRGYSQRVSGVSTGIKWDADSTELAKIFGKDKDYTVQFFIRPDDNLSEGSVIGEIPNLGRLLLGTKDDIGYKLVLEKYGKETVRRATFNEVWRVYPQYWQPWGTTYGTPSYYDENYGMMVWNIEDPAYQAYKDSLVNDGYYSVGGNYNLDSNVWGYILQKKVPLSIYAYVDDIVWEGTWYDTQLVLPVNTYSLVTLQNSNGQQTLAVNDSVSTEFTQFSTKKYSRGENNLTGDYANFRIRDNGCLYDVRGMSMETFETVAAMPRTSSPTYWFPETTEGTMTLLPRDFTDPFIVAGSMYMKDEKETFTGNVTEVRVWDHALTEKEKKNVADRMLGGIEKGLALYWPMDEGMNNYVFDASYTNDVPNGRHAVVGNNITSSTIIPTDAQLSRYGMTNDQGEYTIRSIPFIGNGTTYTVTPSKGIHVFSPSSRNGFIGSGSMALNNYDFTDQSSFKLHGKVTYLNTNIPSDSIQFKIDGDIVQSKDKMICSDSNGEYEISVPIGEHLIECYRDGHRLSSFPLDGSKYDFKQDEAANFIDSTLVNVTGRVNGGFTDQNEPLGFKRSQNRLGKATIKLSLGKESQCSFNYITNDRGESSFGTTNLPVASATENIQSTSYRAGGEHDDTYYIYITTDPKTGEFSAMLPPLRYKVESIKFVGGNDYDDKPVFAQNLPFLDATNANDKAMPMDTLTAKNGERQEYKYSAKQLFHYRANPTITVSQVGMKNGAFGEVKVPIVNNTVNKDSVEVLKFTDKGYQYVYGHPIFVQGHQYEYNIDVCEKYKNLDTGEEVAEVPADAVVTIINDASGMTQVYAENATVNGEEVKMGEPYETPNINVTPDKEGHVSYLFEGGWPNLAEGYLRNMSIGVKVDGRTTMWQAPDSKTAALDLVLLGSISSGTNFVTYGPESVDMILRRPPGSTSEATLTNKTITVTGTTVEYTKDGKSFNGGAHIQPTPTFSYSSGTFGPITVLADSKWKIVIESEHTGEGKWWDTEHTDNDTIYTLTNEIHGTTEGIQYHGDTYIGRSMNLLFGKGFNLGFYKQGDGTYKLMAEEGITVSEKFSTSFVYPQEYIEETLIPNWQAMIKARLTENPTVSGNHWDLGDESRVKGKVMYYTKYKPGDPEFGLSNSDKHWTKEQREAAKGYPSYIMLNGTDDKGAEDEVERAIRQIQQWRDMIALNEQDKLESFDDKDCFVKNYSIAGGTSVSETSTTEISTGTTWESHYEYTYNSENKIGAMLNDAGAYGIIGGTRFHGDVSGHKTGSGTEKSVAWTLSDGDPRTALSVDVFKSKRGWGPIFRTRGGQTANPYEGETLTQYYNGGGEKLDEATMHIEKPQLRVDGAAKLSNVPTGGEGKFNLELTNLSETNSACTYILEAIESSNKTGAILKMDGAVLSMGKAGRAVPMQAGEKINKMLYVSQSDRSITDFENLKLVLRSEKDDATHSDTISLSVEYVPASAIVEMSVDRTLINSDDSNSGGFKVTFTNLDRQDKDLQGVRLQSRRKGTNSWNLEYVWKTDAASVQSGSSSETLLPPTNTFDHAVKFAVDGTYELRGQTYGEYGGSEVTYETEIIEVVQDIYGPKIIGMASHDGGLLTYVDRNEMHLRYNDELNRNAISKSDNFIIEGGLNNRSANSQFTDVAVQLNGDPISTQATYNLNDNDYAFGMWFYRQGDGNIISLGTATNVLALYTHDDGQLAARVGDTHSTFETGATLPAGKWNYIAMSYTHHTDDDPQNRVTLLYANSETNDGPVYVGDNVPVGELEGQGVISIGGNGMKGMMHELTLWNIDKKAVELYETRDEQKAAYTPGLVGYWRMNEGHGKQLADVARSRHMTMNTESWYINNRNLAAKLKGDEPLKVDISTYNPGVTDNFALEMWFRADNVTGNQNAQLLSNMNGLNIGFQDGDLVLETAERTPGIDNKDVKKVIKSFTLSEVNYIDNEWHHLALNVRRGTSAVAYIDGEPVRTMPETSIPALTGHYLYVGGEQTLFASDGSNVGGAERLFQGDIDELRIWASALSGNLIDDRRYERMENGNLSLMGYFPMEDIHRDEVQHVISDFSTQNFGYKESKLTLSGNTTASANAPALLPGSTDLRLLDEDYDFTVSSDEIYFEFKDRALPQMDGNEFTIKVHNVKDTHGNNSESVEWTFVCDFSLLGWLGEVNVEKRWDETAEFHATLYNKTGLMQQNYEISGMPQWITVEEPIGTMSKATQEMTFTILPTVPVGQYTEYIYVTDHLGISRALKVNVKVNGDEPDWAVNPDLYESNMTLTGQVFNSDRICEYEDSKIAAFDDLGNCRGVGHPKYVSTRDAYYVDMVIYGASATQLSTGQRKLTFKLYDASSGITYPVVNVTSPDGTVSDTIMYVPDANLGSYDEPVVFTSTDNMQQTITLPRGWAWVSLYVQPKSTAINDVMPKSTSELKKYMNVKSKKAISTPARDYKGFIGELEDIVPGNMYKIQVSTATTLGVMGSTIDVQHTPCTIYPQWNWIGSLSNSILSVADAFADLQPEKGDMVKTRTAMATYDGRGTWEGTLQNIVPGQGYIYFSQADHAKTFNYPLMQANNIQTRGVNKAMAATSSFAAVHYEPVDEYSYPDNMNVIAIVKKGGVEVEDAEVAAFVNDECRGAVACKNGYYFLTILGSATDDIDNNVELRVYLDDEEYTIGNISFVSDAVYGTLDDPYILDLDLDPTGIVIPSLATVKYATFYDSETAYMLTSGLTASVVTGMNNKKLVYEQIAEGDKSNNVIPKGVAVLLTNSKSDTSPCMLIPTESTASYLGINWLYGSDVATTTKAEGSNRFYKLSYGHSNTELSDVFGWYWGAANGGAFQIEGHRAWLAVPTSEGISTRSFSIDGEATDIVGVDMQIEELEPYYDLQGRRVLKSVSPGIYIYKGKKINVK